MKLHLYIKIGRDEGPKTWDGGCLTFCVNAPPTDGKANKQLVVKLGEWLKIPKTSINIVKGETSRHKTVDVRITQDELSTLLAEVPLIPHQISLLQPYKKRYSKL